MSKLILVAFFILGIVYSIVTPIFEASDEVWHYPYVKYLADGQGLPVQDAQQHGLWRQEGSQPPLYYALGAALTFWIDTQDLASVRVENPHGRSGDALPLGNKNLVVHTPAEGFPWQGTTLAVHLIRLLSVLMGSVTVYLVYRIAGEVTPLASPLPGGTERGGALALGAMALTAFNPMFLFISASVNNDNLVVMLCTLALWLMVRIGESANQEIGKSANRQIGDARYAPLLLGLVLGLAALAKVSGLGLYPLAALTIAVVSWRKRSWRWLLQAGGIIFGLAAMVAGWWYLRNWQLYGDPTGLAMMVAVAGARSPVPTLWQLAAEWRGFVMAYWGLFGGVNIPMDAWVYDVLNLFAVIAAVGLVVSLARSLVANRAEAAFNLAILAVWPVLLFVALIRWTLMTMASQGRLLFPAIASISLFLILGIIAWFPSRWQRAIVTLIAGGMLALAAVSPFRYIAPAYVQPPILSQAEIAALPHRLSADFGGQLRLLGYRWEQEKIEPGEIVHLTLYWQAPSPTTANYSIFVHLLDENDLILGQIDTYPGLGSLPTSQWPDSQVIADTYPIRISPSAYAPSAVRWEVGVYDHRSGARLRLANGDDNLRFAAGEVVRRAGDLPNPVSFNLEDKIALVGYEMDRRLARPGETVRLTLYWQGLAPAGADYTVFTHVLGDQNHIWAQKDSQPQGGARPTSRWPVGEVVKDEYLLTLDPQTPVGVYDVELGMYLSASGKRLTLLGEGAQAQDDRIILTRVRVQ